MSRNVTIVMYHYVRDLEHSRFPAIKGLSVERFCRQLDYIQARFTPIAAEDLIGALSPAKKELPANPILLTFDDGYTDHFTNVFPLLDARGIQGCFFPPAQSVLEHKVLDVNKIQFILAAVSDVGSLVDQVFSSLSEFGTKYPLQTKEAYFHAIPEQHRYDSRDVTVLKRLLQRELPEPVRAEIVRRLFAEHVTADESSFACELYMSVDQIACLQAAWNAHRKPRNDSCVARSSISGRAGSLKLINLSSFCKPWASDGMSGPCVIPMGASMTRSFMSFRLVIVSLGFYSGAPHRRSGCRRSVDPSTN